MIQIKKYSLYELTGLYSKDEDFQNQYENKEFKYFSLGLNKNSIYQVLLDNKKIFGIIEYGHDPYHDNSVCMFAIDVLESYRNQGYSSKLIQAMVEDCISLGIKNIYFSSYSQMGSIMLPKVVSKIALEYKNQINLYHKSQGTSAPQNALEPLIEINSQVIVNDKNYNLNNVEGFCSFIDYDHEGIKYFITIPSLTDQNVFIISREKLSLKNNL